MIDYIITDYTLMKDSSPLYVDQSDIGSSDHYLVWLELGRIAKHKRVKRRVIRKWRVRRFSDSEVRSAYRAALRGEVESFSESIKKKMEMGSGGKAFVSDVLVEWRASSIE